VTVQPIWEGSPLAELVKRVNAALPEALAARRLKPLKCGIGPAESARNTAPPAITWVDGDGAQETYRRPSYQDPSGHTSMEAVEELEVEIRGVNVAQATQLREALFATVNRCFSEAVMPVRGRRFGGNQGEQGFRIVARLDVHWSMLREFWIKDFEITGVDAGGYVAGFGGDDPEAITTATTP